MLMMIKKDLIVCRNGLLINILVLLVFAAVMFKIALLDMFLFVNIIYIVLLAITPITTEDKLKADPLTLSLPFTRKKMVGSRYLYALLAIIIMIVFIFIYGYVLNFFISSNNIDFSNALTFSRVFSIFFFTVVAVSFFIPFVYKFGQNGIMLGLGGTVLISTVFFMITAIGLRSEMMKRIVGGFFERIENGGLSNFFYSISQNMGTSLALAMLIGIMVVAVFLSMKLSMFIYARKEF
jgi:ABC-type transport system involved in multi-copper enzyme maturation permease subunit